MGNLFIVFTPLQLFVSQQIIRQEKLEKCVLIEAWRSQFGKVYDMMRINELWNDIVVIENIHCWEDTPFNSLSHIKEHISNYNKFGVILREHNIKHIYLGEVLNPLCRFISVRYSHLGYEIVFFEEGTSHYIDRPYTEDKSLKHKLKVLMYDILFYLPVYNVLYAKWRLEVNRPYDELPIDKRFSIIPYHNKSFDVRLAIKPLFSSKLEKYIEANITKDDERRVMLMTDPLRELMEQKDLYLYFETIRECINSIDSDAMLYIKFHPREIEISRKKILEIANESRRKYKVLSEEVNICVEYYLQKYRFEKIYFFNAATFFYNGYAFPKTEFVKLMPIVYAKAKKAGVNNLAYMENMLKMIVPFKD